MLQNHQSVEMENHGVDYLSVGATILTLLMQFFTDIQSVVVVMVGLSTLAYNGLRIYNDFVKKSKKKS